MRHTLVLFGLFASAITAWAQAEIRIVDEFIYPARFTAPGGVWAGGITPSVPTDFKTREVGASLRIAGVTVGRGESGGAETAEVIRRQNLLNNITDLMVAATDGDLPKVRELLAVGAKINAQNVFGSTALMGAAAGDHREVVALLLSKGADPNLANKHGATPLMFAARNGYTEVAELLLVNGAKINTTDEAGRSALLYATDAGQTGTIELLLKRGADKKLTTRDGQTPVTVAQARGRREVLLLLGQ